MNNTVKAKLFVVVFTPVLLIASVIMAKPADQGQQQPAPASQQSSPGAERPAGQQAQQPAETLQVLKGMPRQQIIGEMRKIASTLGVECNFCHINPFQAETPRKAVARLMMRDYTMTMKHKDGSALSCNDCHTGGVSP